jgi:hypothetical protein
MKLGWNLKVLNGIGTWIKQLGGFGWWVVKVLSFLVKSSVG